MRSSVRALISPPQHQPPQPYQFCNSAAAARIEARGEYLSTQIDVKGSSWALAAELLERYELTHTWDASAPVNLRGILMPDQLASPTRAWCMVLEFAEKFGINMSFEPFRLGERLGG